MWVDSIGYIVGDVEAVVELPHGDRAFPRDYTLAALVSAANLVDGLLDPLRGSSDYKVTASHSATIGIVSRHAPPA